MDDDHDEGGQPGHDQDVEEGHHGLPPLRLQTERVAVAVPQEAARTGQAAKGRGGGAVAAVGDRGGRAVVALKKTLKHFKPSAFLSKS